MPAAVLTIDINARLAKLEEGLTSANRSLGNFGKQFDSIGKSAGRALVGLVSIGAVAGAYETLKNKAIEGERAINQLNAVLRATGNAAGLTKQGLDGISQSLQKSSIFDDDAITAAETALLRFRTVQGDTFRQAIALAPDVATALGTDLVTAAQALGRALTDPEGGMKALKAAGIQLSEQQKDLAARLIESGDKAGAQKIVLDELRKSVGGAAESDNSGLYGSTKRAARAWDDLQKTLGRQLVGQNTGAIDKLTTALELLDKWAKTADLSLSNIFTHIADPAGSAARDLNRLAALSSQKANSRLSVGKIDTRLADETAATMGEAAGVQKQIDEKRYEDQKANLKRRADNSAVYYAEELAMQKDAVARQSSALEASYDRNLVSSASYFAKQRELAKQSYDAEFANLGKQGKDIEAALAGVFDAKSGKTIPPSREEQQGYSTKLLGIANQQYELRLKNGQKIQDINEQEAKSVEKLTDTYAGLANKLAEVRGDTVGAAIGQFDLANGALARQIQSERASPNPAARDAADRAAENLSDLRNQTILQAQLTVETRLYGQEQDRLGLAVDRVNLLQTAGYITEIDALNRTSALNASKIQQMTAIADRAEAIAKALPDGIFKEQAILDVQRMRLEIDKLATQTDLLGDKFQAIFRDSIAQGIDQFAQGGQKLSDIVKNVQKSIVSGISGIASKNISEALFAKDGPLGGLGSMFGSLFGGGASKVDPSIGLTTAGTSLTSAGTLLTTAATALQTAAATLSAGGASSGGGSFLSSLFGGGGGSGSDLGTLDQYDPGFANGTSNAPGGAAWVGERGPEKVMLPAGAKVIPANVLNARRSERGATRHQSVVVNNHFTIGGNVDRRSQDQIAAAAFTGTVRARRKVL